MGLKVPTSRRLLLRSLQLQYGPVFSVMCGTCFLPSACRPSSCTEKGTVSFGSGAGRYLAEHIAGAKYVELPGEDHLFFVGDTDALLDEIEEFLTGTHQAPRGRRRHVNHRCSPTSSPRPSSQPVWDTASGPSSATITMPWSEPPCGNTGVVKSRPSGTVSSPPSTPRPAPFRRQWRSCAGAKTMGLDVRAGVHVGEVEVRPDDVVGLAVTISKRICDLGGPGEVLVSEAVKLHLVGSDMAVTEYGTHVLKGVPGEWRLFAAVG